MSLRRMLFLLVALIASGSTIIVGRMWLQNQKPVQVVVEAQQEPAVPMVLVAKGNIPTGFFLRPENLKWEHWPQNGIAPSYVTDAKRKLEDYIGAVVRVGLSDGEPITDMRVVRPGERGFLAAVLTPGFRAITVNVTPSSGLAGLVFPGDRIDLVASFKVEFEGKQDGGSHPARYASETVESNLRVLAVDQRVDDQNKDIVVAKTATLEVTPKQAEIIAIVAEVGKFSLSLRSMAQENDPGPTDKELTSSYTWDNEAARMLAPPGKSGAGHTVTIVRGGDAKDVEMPRSMR
ncbi:MAG TPA: Flp pilus assembly protein CpaB [Stellaceae bacterium]|nr:Flp pilus assembly protein CpaB [Stellaceae bacterium]